MTGDNLTIEGRASRRVSKQRGSPTWNKVSTRVSNAGGAMKARASKSQRPSIATKRRTKEMDIDASIQMINEQIKLFEKDTDSRLPTLDVIPDSSISDHFIHYKNA